MGKTLEQDLAVALLAYRRALQFIAGGDFLHDRGGHKVAMQNGMPPDGNAYDNCAVCQALGSIADLDNEWAHVLAEPAAGKADSTNGGTDA